MKNNLSYYQRDTDSHKHAKFKLLRAQFSTKEHGWAAEGRFWALNDMIGEAENCILDLNKQFVMAEVCDVLALTPEEVRKFVDLLIKPCELVKNVKKRYRITTDRVQETFEKVQKERHAARLRKQVKSTGSGEIPESSAGKSESSGEPTKKGKERKGKERKEININGLPYINSPEVRTQALTLFRDCWKISADPVVIEYTSQLISFYGLGEVSYAFEETKRRILDKNKWSLPYVEGILSNRKKASGARKQEEAYHANVSADKKSFEDTAQVIRSFRKNELKEDNNSYLEEKPDLSKQKKIGGTNAV